MHTNTNASHSILRSVGWITAIAFWATLFFAPFAIHARVIPGDPADTLMLMSGAMYLTMQYWYLFMLPAVLFVWGTAASVRAGRPLFVALFKWATIAAMVACFIVVLLVVGSLILFFS